MRIILRGLLGLILVYGAVVAAMVLLQRQLQYAPTRRAPAPAEAGFEGASVVSLAAADGVALEMWHAPAPAGRPTILYLHGNAGEIADRPRRWAFYRQAGFGVAFLSYRGFGGSGGAISEAGLHRDADAAHAWLLAQGVAADRLAVVGESLGTGVAVRLAADQPVGALLLEAPFTSAADIAAARYPWLPVRLLMRDPFPSRDRIARVAAPILIQHGETDAVIPFASGRALFDAAPEPKTFIARPGLGHDALFDPETWAAERDFLNRLWPPG
jgi:hypothetical protein